MGKKLNVIILNCAVILFFICQPQTIYSQDLSNGQAKSLVARLQNEKTDTGRFNSLLKLAKFQVSKPGERKPDLDSARRYIDQAGTLLLRINSVESFGFFNLISSCYYKENGQKELSTSALNKALNYLKAGTDKALLGAAYLESASRLENSQNVQAQKIRFFQLAIDAYALTKNKRQLGDCLRLLADVRIRFAMDYKALPELDSAKLLYQQAKSGDWQQLYILYSQFYAIQENQPKALAALLNAMRVTLTNDSTGQACEIYNHAAIAFSKMKEYRKAIFYAQKALEIAEKNNSLSDIYDINFNKIICYSALGMSKTALIETTALESKYAVSALPVIDQTYHYVGKLRIYNDLKQFSKGQACFKYLEGMTNRQEVNNDIPESIALREMVRFCIGTGQFHRAQVLLTLKKEFTKRLGSNPLGVGRDYSLQISLDTIKKDYKLAVTHLIELKNITDSVFSETQAKQQKALEVQYETELKDKENNLQKQKILTLTEQQKLQRAEIKTAGAMRNIILLSAFGVIVIAALIYRQYVKGRKSNAIIGQKNKRLEQLLTENEWLLKEVHHRVKNNLQIITSLLNSQSAYLTDESAMEAIMKSKGRVESISLIHQKLYKSTNYSSINMPEYIRDLVDYLRDGFEGDQKIYFDLAIDPVFLDVGDAVPIGLIINEGVTNAIKYAFPYAAENVIEISLRKNEDSLILVIKDNGKGFTENNENSSFGLSLINGLANQLNGVFEKRNAGGTVISITFKPTMILDDSNLAV